MSLDARKYAEALPRSGPRPRSTPVSLPRSWQQQSLIALGERLAEEEDGQRPDSQKYPEWKRDLHPPFASAGDEESHNSSAQ